MRTSTYDCGAKGNGEPLTSNPWSQYKPQAVKPPQNDNILFHVHNEKSEKILWKIHRVENLPRSLKESFSLSMPKKQN